MSTITINSNIASLRAQRRFSASTLQLRESFERLSSGLRINRPKDDASGLAIASDLDVDSRVLAQGVRNFNDAISLLNIAESAGGELTGILLRQRELATQAANGTLSQSQRLALDEEANALGDEYNRILSTMAFNGQVLLDGTFGSLTAQGDYGVNGSIRFALGSELAGTVGNGTFQTAANFAAGNDPRGVAIGDFNGDDISDIATSDKLDNRVSISFGNGNGTFKARISYATGTTPMNLIAADVTGDGVEDLFTANYASETVSVLIANANGTFLAPVNYSVGDNPYDVKIVDVNSDSILDMVTADSGQAGGGDTLTVRLGTGSGTFGAAQSYAAVDNVGSVQVADFNDDGRMDLLTATSTGVDAIAVLFGNGNGTFFAPLTTPEYDNPGQIDYGDFNDDGLLDVVTTGLSTFTVRLGNGNGTFKLGTTYSTGVAGFQVFTEDLDENGTQDLILNSSAGASLSVYLGTGTGSFQLSSTYTTSGASRQIAVGDLNGDGATDIAVASYGSDSFNVLIANTRSSTFLTSLDLTTRAAALDSIDEIDEVLTRVSRELGQIGATQNRISSAISAIAIRRENYVAAASQIRDIDVASEAATLVRSRILQDAGAAILGQANQSAELALIFLQS